MKSQNPICEVDAIGTKHWYLNGQRHRTDGPASEYSNGEKHWYLNGQLHRTDGPASDHPNGEKFWYLNGQLHRTDGPAIEYPDGTKFWYLNGQHHRADGPAIEYLDGTKEWYLNGKYHENPSKSYKNSLQLGDLLVIENEVNFVGRKEGLACLLLPSNSWIFEWEKTL